MQARVTIQPKKYGYIVSDYDFPSNLYAIFEGRGSLLRALKYCSKNKLTIINLPSFSSLITEGGQPKETINDN